MRVHPGQYRRDLEGRQFSGGVLRTKGICYTPGRGRCLTSAGKVSHHGVGMKGAINNCVWIGSGPFLHIFHFFAEFAIFGNGISAFDAE